MDYKSFRRRHRCRQRNRPPHQAAGAGDLHARRAVRHRIVRRSVQARHRRVERAGARLERRRRRHQAEGRVHGRISTAPSAPISSTTASTTSSCRARRRCSFSTTSRPASCRQTWPNRSSRGWRKACKDNGCALLGGETAEMPGFYADGEYDVAGFIVGAVDRAQIIDGRAIAPGDVLIGLPVERPAHQRLLAGAQDRLRRDEADGRQPSFRTWARRSARRLLRTHRSYLPVIKPLLGRRTASRAWRTSPAAASPTTCRACFRRAPPRASIAPSWRVPADLPLARRIRPRARIRPAPLPQHGHRHDPRRVGRGCRRGSPGPSRRRRGQQHRDWRHREG